MAKHAGATAVEVALTATASEIALSVTDFGNGFDVNKVGLDRGLGLVSMEERVHLVDGRFSVQSPPGTGTSVKVRIPLRQEAA